VACTDYCQQHQRAGDVRRAHRCRAFNIRRFHLILHNILRLMHLPFEKDRAQSFLVKRVLTRICHISTLFLLGISNPQELSAIFWSRLYEPAASRHPTGRMRGNRDARRQGRGRKGKRKEFCKPQCASISMSNLIAALNLNSLNAVRVSQPSELMK
jgi:hypothetical protein